MERISLDALGIRKMASGHLSLDLSPQVGWKEFPALAEHFLRECDGTILEKAESPDMRMWKVRIRETEFWLVFDDYPLRISLESLGSDGDRVVSELNTMFALHRRRLGHAKKFG